MELFGVSLFGKNKKQKEEDTQEIIPSIIEPDVDDGTHVVSTSAAYYGMYVDLDGTIKDEITAIQKWREISIYPEVDLAVQDIVNEAIPYEDETSLVDIILDEIEYGDLIKDTITEEFKNVLRLLKFDERAPDLFRRWYVDGKLYHNILIDENNPKNGIVELRPIEATKIKKVVEMDKEKTPEGVEVVKGIREYYVYNHAGFIPQQSLSAPTTPTMTVGVKMSTDAVIYTPSGFVDQNSGIVLSYLQKAVRPANQLRMLEDAVVIYRMSRAPERRIFYVDVGTLPKAKAEQYVKDIMNRYRNKLVYDSKTGEIRDDKKYMSMLEDFWMPRRDGSKGTEITTIPAGQNLGELTDVEYFKEKLYHSMNIPLSRVQPEAGFNMGRSTEINRDEVKFQKFINKIRRKFCELFYDILRTQLILKNVISPEDWDELKEQIKFRFQKDNFFAELKNQELMMQRVQVAQSMDPMLGKYFSVEWVRKNIFMQTDEEIAEMQKQMDAEAKEHPEWYMMMQQYDQMQQQQQMMQQGGGFGGEQDSQDYQDPNQQDQNQQPY